jgi:hypothetical protein
MIRPEVYFDIEVVQLRLIMHFVYLILESGIYVINWIETLYILNCIVKENK